VSFYKREDISPVLIERFDAAVAECRAARLPEIVPVEGLRPQVRQDAYYAQGRFPLAAVNGLRVKAGLWAISEEMNGHIVSFIKTLGAHGPNSKGKSRAIDFGLKHPITGSLYDPKIDTNGNDLWDFQEVADILEKHGLKSGFYFERVINGVHRKLCDAGHVELPVGVDP